MVKLLDSICIEAPAERVWAVLARLEDIELWAEPVLSARCDPAARSGVGAVRVCLLRGGITLTERWTGWDDGRSFTYEGSGLPLVHTARNTWTVRAAGDDRTLLVTEAEVVLRGGVLGRLLEPLVSAQSRRLGRRSLAALAHLIETGGAPTVRHARLPRPAAAC